MWLEQIRKITTPVKAQQPTSYRQREDAARRLALAGATLDEITAGARVSETLALRMLAWAAQAR
jgi:hypothetical protein